MSTTREDRIFAMWKAARKGRGKEGECVTGAAFDVARVFKISCAEVRSIVAEHRAAVSR